MEDKHKIRQGDGYMSKSLLDGRKILLVDHEPDVLKTLEEEIGIACPNCTLDKAATYGQPRCLSKKNDYEVVVPDIMGVRGCALSGGCSAIRAQGGPEAAPVTSDGCRTVCAFPSRDPSF